MADSDWLAASLHSGDGEMRLIFSFLGLVNSPQGAQGLVLIDWIDEEGGSAPHASTFGLFFSTKVTKERGLKPLAGNTVAQASKGRI